MAISRIPLSGSSGGRGIKVAATSTPGTTIHATGTSATDVDEVWIYAYNDSVDPRVSLTIEYGGTTDPDDLITLLIPIGAGLTFVIPGLVLMGTGSAARTISAYAATANAVNVFGYVNRITP